MVRTCPFCKSHLSLSDKFFCSECGEVLPSNLIAQDNTKSKTIEFVNSIVSKKTPSNIANMPKVINAKKSVFRQGKLLVIILVALIIPVGAVFLFDKTAWSINKIILPVNSQVASDSPKENNIIQNNSFSIKTECSYMTGNLLNTDLIKLIPFNTDFYMESQDAVGLFNDLIDSEIVVDSKLVSFYNQNKDLLSGPLAFFVIKDVSEYTYGVVVGVQNLGLKELNLEKYNAEQIGNFIVMTTNSSIITEVKDANNSVAKNLSLTPTYASAKMLLSKNGKLVILPTTKAGNGYVFQLLDKKLTPNMLSVVNGFLDSKLDYAVVL